MGIFISIPIEVERIKEKYTGYRKKTVDFFERCVINYYKPFQINLYCLYIPNQLLFGWG